MQVIVRAMGTSLTIRGQIVAGASFGALELALKSREGHFAPVLANTKDEVGRDVLEATIHPAAEPLRITDLAQNEVRFEVQTGTAGPGFHQHVVELVESLHELVRIESVDDSSGYWELRDRTLLERALRMWLRGAAMEVLSLEARRKTGLQLSLPEGIVFRHEGVVATPLGPRDHDWLERASRDPAQGENAFPWWCQGVDAEVLQKAAEAAMWIDVRWRSPVTEEERALVARCVGWLEAGHALEPERAWPWAEWSQLYEALGNESLAATRVHLRAGGLEPKIGYRRHPVRILLADGWSIETPGQFADRWDERGVYSAWDGTRSLFVSTLSAPGSRSTAATLSGLPALEGEGETLTFERGDLMALARFGRGREGDQTFQVMTAQAALGSRAVLGTFTFQRDSERQWALDAWASLARTL